MGANPEKEKGTDAGLWSAKSIGSALRVSALLIGTFALTYWMSGGRLKDSPMPARQIAAAAPVQGELLDAPVPAKAIPAGTPTPAPTLDETKFPKVVRITPVSDEIAAKYADVLPTKPASATAAPRLSEAEDGPPPAATPAARGVDFNTIDQQFPGARKATPAPAATNSEESADIVPVKYRGKDYSRVTFGLLAGYEYKAPKPGELEKDATAMPAALANQIPEPIKKLNGQQVAVQGFMIPLELEKGKVKSFVLVRNQMFCCFGAVPMMNEWLHIKMQGDARAPFIADVPIRVYGAFDVGEVVTKGTLMSIYRLDATEVEVTGAL